MNKNPYQAGERLLGRVPDRLPYTDVDITLVIGGSSGMSRLMETLPSALADRLKCLKARKPLRKLRLRTILFGDLYMDADALSCTDFLPPEWAHARPLTMHASPRKSALEALHLAMLGRWTRETAARRHVIVLITDAGAYLPEDAQRRIDSGYETRLAEHCGSAYEPMPLTLEQLRLQWRDGAGDIDNFNSRLLIFAPAVLPWDRMENWPRARIEPISADAVQSLTSDEVLAHIARAL